MRDVIYEMITNVFNHIGEKEEEDRPHNHIVYYKKGYMCLCFYRSLFHY